MSSLSSDPSSQSCSRSHCHLAGIHLPDEQANSVSLQDTAVSAKKKREFYHSDGIYRYKGYLVLGKAMRDFLTKSNHNMVLKVPIMKEKAQKVEGKEKNLHQKTERTS